MQKACMKPETYTTFQVSKMLGVYLGTVSRWIDSGKMKAYTTPGGHRRIERTSLQAFLKTYNMPIPDQLKSAEQLSILIVDDDEVILTILQDVFKKMPDFKIYTASDGFEAGQIANAIKPVLIILDIMLPGLNGINVCRQINNTLESKIIAITGHHTPSLEAEVLEAGADAYFRKPFDIEQLMNCVKELIEIKAE